MKSRKAFAYMFVTLFVLAMVAAGPAADAQYSGYNETIINYFNGGAFYPVGDLVPDASGNLYGVTIYGDSTGECLPACGSVFELSKAPGGGWQTTYLHLFNTAGDGSMPGAGLVWDAQGNLYGTTLQGGAYGYGAVYELSPIRTGGWSETILYSFSGVIDGSGPGGSIIPNPQGFGGGPGGSLIFDAQGNLYGVTYGGGTAGAGVVFELSPNPVGGWTESVLYTFTGGSDGANPVGRLVFDAAGNLYGATQYGGISNPPYSGGVVFELSPNPVGGWAETVLHAFDPSAEGGQPNGSLIFDAKGNLYGTSWSGNSVFELSPNAVGGWTETPIWIFDSSTWYAFSDLIFDKYGNLYGTTAYGGSSGAGTVYRLSPHSNGAWRETILHSFTGGVDGGNVNVASTDGGGSVSGVLIDSAGKLFGMTELGGIGACSFDGAYCGTVYELQPPVPMHGRPIWRVPGLGIKTQPGKTPVNPKDRIVGQPAHRVDTRDSSLRKE